MKVKDSNSYINFKGLETFMVIYSLCGLAED